MGRKKLPIDEMEILDMRSRGKSIKDIASALDISTATLSRRIAELKYEQGILTKYRYLQGLQLTGIQFRILESITPEKINNSSLADLIRCFYILGKSTRAIEGKDSYKIKGLVGYLIELERDEMEKTERNHG